jgi:ABC-2 type transport system ATP-binding protein
MDMIKLINLTKVYRGLRAVDRINLEIKKGLCFGFLGPNGAGKTTTIKMMAGVLKPTEGQIIINGHDLAKEPSAAKQCVGFIPDRPFMYEKLTGLEFLHFVAGLYGLDDTSLLNRRIGDLLGLFELRHWEEELIESYSHGMKQRLIMCAALIHQPKVAKLVKDIFREQAEIGTTLFISTHSLAVAEEVCDEIAIIQVGRIIARGTAGELREQAGTDGNLEDIFLRLTQER